MLGPGYNGWKAVKVGENIIIIIIITDGDLCDGERV